MNSIRCPHCKRSKGPDEALCHSCFYALPYDLRKFLYRPKGDGFEGALETSLEWLANKYGEKINVSKS